jgi:hypothetical protein
MRTLKILLVLVVVLLSGFAKDLQRTEAGVVVPMKLEGVIITNPSAGLTICTPVGDPYPTIAHSRTGWLQGHQTHGGKLITEQSTWEISSCSTNFTTKLNTSQIEGVVTVANGDSYYYTCIMIVNIVTNDVILYITATGGVGRFEGVTGQMTLTGIHTESGIPISGEGFLSFPK